MLIIKHLESAKIQGTYFKTSALYFLSFQMFEKQYGTKAPQIGHPHAGNPPSGNEYMHRGMHKNKPPPSPIGNGWGGVPYSCVRVRYQLSR